MRQTSFSANWARTLLNTFFLVAFVAITSHAQAPNWLSVVRTTTSGTGNVTPKKCVLDSNGDVLVTGNFGGTVTFGTLPSITSGTGSTDAFVAKLSSSSRQWLWVKSAGGPNSDYATDLAITQTGEVVIVGNYQGSASFGTFVLTSATTPTGSGFTADGFVAKLSSTGQWMWASGFGGNGYDDATGVALASNGDAFVTGQIHDRVNFGAYSVITSGFQNAYVSKISASGQWLWAVCAGGNSSDNKTSKAIAVTSGGDIVITGSFSGPTASFGSLPALNNTGGYDIFVTKLSGIAGQWLWAVGAGGTDIEHGTSLKLTPSDDVVLSGPFHGTIRFAGQPAIVANGNKDAFVAKLSANGTQWFWSTQVSNTLEVEANGMSITSAGDVIIVGSYNAYSARFGTQLTLPSSGGTNIYTAKLLGSNGQWSWATRSIGVGSGNALNIAYGVAVTPLGESVIAGFFQNTVAFGSLAPISSVGQDAFVAWLGSTPTATKLGLQRAALGAWPNPTSNFLNLTIPITAGNNHSEIQLINVLGKVVLRQDFIKSSAKGQQLVINLSSLPSGVYTVEMLCNGQFLTQKVVIAH